ncbi:MAG TPA: hypothetical protein VIJ09_08100 [Acidimicrobiales bacterium]
MATVTPRPLSPTTSPRRGVDVIPPDIGTAPVGPQSLQIVAWTDPVIDTLGHDPRSWYVEQFWVGIIGPTATWLLRRIVGRFDTEPDGFELDLDETARGLGLGGRDGRHSPFQRALSRCVSFKLARPQGPGALAVHRRIPPLTLRQLDRLPPSIQKLHREWSASQSRTGVLDEARNRSRRLALKLLDIGADRTAVELQLIRWRVHPAVAHEATQWAMSLPSS